MNIEHLQLFIRVANTLNISQAGQELGLSAAVASTHLNKLEKSLGVKLIYRTTRQISLTEEGRIFLPHAESVLSAVEAARAAVGSGNTNPKGILRMTASASFGRQHLVPAIGSFLKKYPDIQIDMSFSDAMVDLVEGGFDVAIRSAPLKDSNLIARKLANDRRIVCASPSYLEQFGIPMHPNDVKHHQCVNFRDRDIWTFKTAEGKIAIKTNTKIRTDNGESMRDASLEGLGLAISSTWNIYKHLQRGELVQVLDEYPLDIDVAIWAVYPSSRLVPPKLRVFIDFLSTWFGDTPYWESELSALV
ncbi:LysR family transcriptional regulator [Pseudoalteromonas xiamenensis]|uniref:LysR family transcriptional regulator n=1 Tax=Pseudoalteromonas xiamenensis TaxID=882626 RepID=A0A975HPF6_9GAMM|nr:LysR family transcriptional regulator [Pseudoalteromonas xiamenensis]QTH73210.1 LysR family transcriptional regulator [Pseudoalteromonas xiamenensis]